ncbi:MAG: LysR family transcriptional regulator [Proteobacteria bacterium]|nr:LysR family transcriptional regulator [Pseudomonadota bacterium]
MRYDLIDFRVFANIAEESNLTRGAARSYLSVPAASQRIKNLEEMLGVKLLQRSSQGVELTEAGKIYLTHARVIFAQMERLTSDLQAQGSGISGQLKILANTTAITEFLPPVLHAYLPQHPRVKIDLRERLSDEAARGVRDGAADLCLISGDVSTEGLASKVILSSRLVVVIPKGHPLSSSKEVRFSALLEEEFVALLEGYVTQEFLRQQALRLHREMKVRVQVAGFEAVFRMVEAGVGIGIVPEVVVTRLNQNNTVGICSLSDAWAVRDYQLCARSFDTLPRFAREFVETLERHLTATTQTDGGAGSNA